MNSENQNFKIIYDLLFACIQGVVDSLNQTPLIPDHLKNNARLRKQNAGIFFEVAVYLTARLDVAMVQFNQDPNTRKKLFFYVTDALNRTFKQYLENDNLFKILDNRMDSYGKCFREGKGDVFKQLHFILVNNIKHTVNAKKLEVWKDGISPIVITDIFSDMHSTIAMVEIEKNIVGRFACALKHLLQDNKNFLELSSSEISQRIKAGLDEAKDILSNTEKIEDKPKQDEECEPVFDEDNSVEVSSLLKKADELCKEDKYDDAIIVYKRIMQMDPGCCDAYYGLSCAYSYKEIEDETTNRYAKEHVALYEKLEQIDPGFDSYQVLAGHLADVGRYEDAIQYYDKAIQHDLNELKKDPSYLDWLKDTYEGKAKALLKIKRYKEALQCYDKAIAKLNDSDGNCRSCSELFAAKREIYCILQDSRMISKMDKEFAKAEDLWKEYKRSGEYDKKIGAKFKGISQSLEKGITGEEKLRADLCKLVLLKLKEGPEHAYFRNRIETINKIIDQALEETGYEKDIRYIEKAHVARLVNETLDNEKNTWKSLKKIFLGFLTKFLELFRGNK